MKLPASNISTIAVFRSLQLGDMLCSVPALRTLRHAFPQARITLIGLPWARTFCHRFSHYLDNFLSFPGYPGLPEQEVDPVSVLSFLKSVQDEHFDLAIQMQGNGSYVNPLTQLFAARYAAGYYRKQDYCPNEDLFMLYPDQGSEIHRHLSLMEFLGLEPQGDHLEFPLDEADEEDFRQLHVPVSPGQYICLHPGSRGGWRQWPPELFASLADDCARNGLKVIITGTADEDQIARTVMNKMKHEALNLCGKTSMGAIAWLIKEARMLISNCTGVSHIAAAVKTPSLVISMDGEPHRWAPLNTSIHTTIDWTQRPSFSEVQVKLKTLLNQLADTPIRA